MPTLTGGERRALADHRRMLVEFAAGSAHPAGGFAWLDGAGRARLDRPVETWITCRMTHVFALASMQGVDRAAGLMDHGVAALLDRLHDVELGGWYAAVDAGGPRVSDKRAYEHAFVVLAAASAATTGHDGGRALLDDALEVFERRFWDEGQGLLVEVWDRSWSVLEDYRGINANMHGVEALLAAHDATGDPVWLSRAARVTERVVHGFARAHEWRLPEHYSSDWQARLDYNRDEPAHPFRPFGVTVGHLMEWARLALHLRTALGDDAPAHLLPDARAMFGRAVSDGWHADGADGFVYTTDFTGTPVVRGRLHWVVCEGIAAAWALADVTGEKSYRDWYDRLWAYADAHLVDHELGSWRHELDPDNRPAESVWSGKPDVYHAYQAALLPELGPITSFAGALSASRPG